MIVLRASQELKLTFEKLIDTMKVPVAWNGLMVVVDNYLILQGEVRSLFFHFDSRKVVTNLIELTIKEDGIRDISDNLYVRNVINMILYVFGKWGTIKGLKVEKNFAQLNQLFSGILKEIGIEPDYTPEQFRFYKEGIRITYEDVIQSALEAAEREMAVPEEKEQGLWHKLVWERLRKTFPVVETTLSERRKTRIGNNFYLTGYRCPFCDEKLHMGVYPEGIEFQIETAEGGVFLARAYACQECCSFYTPYPEKLLAEGDVFVMDFEGDRTAYEDYLELLGKNCTKTSNYQFNRFVRPLRRSEEQTQEEESLNEEEASKQESMLDEKMRRGKAFAGVDFGKLSDAVWKRFSAKVEEGFYPDGSVERIEEKIREQNRKRNQKKEKESGSKTEDREKRTQKKERQEKKTSDRGGKEEQSDSQSVRIERAEPSNRKGTNARTEKEHVERSGAAMTEAEQKYRARIEQFERLSDRQRGELSRSIKSDRELDEGTKARLTEEIKEKKRREDYGQLRQKTEVCRDKSYAAIQKLSGEVSEANISAGEKEELLHQLYEFGRAQGEKEVRKLMQEMPETLDRKGYQAYLKKIESYKEVDLAPYRKELESGLITAETQEIAAMVKRARKRSREDYTELSNLLIAQDFSPEALAPYQEKIRDKIAEIDKEAIDTLCQSAEEMTFEEAMQVRDAVENGPFLPELKQDAVRMLRKRLAKIKTEECELLVRKLREELKEAGICEPANHYFYPARDVFLNRAEPSDTEIIDFAAASYGAGRGEFEYPIIVVDTSRGKKGDKGMFLTPEKLYYSSLMTSYHISVFEIESIRAAGGILNRGLYAHCKNGTKTKLPYAVEPGQLPKLAEVLDGYIKYLQEKPFSRKETYLAKQQHDTICCFRCGYMYKGRNVCPKCGYKNNE